MRGSFEYLKKLPLYTTEKPYEILVPKDVYSSAGAKAPPRTNLAFETVDKEVVDVRGRESDFSLDTHGFAFCRTAEAPRAEDLADREAIQGRYVPAVEELVRREVGGVKRVVSFDWRVRRSINPIEFSKRILDLDDGLEALLPAVHPHVDQSAAAAIQRVRRHLGAEAEELLKCRVRIINVWRPLSKVTSWPLALCDSQSVAREDLVDTDIIRRRYIGETYFGAHSPAHRWHYLSGQVPEEVTMIKIFDSSEDVAARFCMHASFRGTEDAEKQLRESIEVRTLVFSDW